jgi:hypothetical protein
MACVTVASLQRHVYLHVCRHRDAVVGSPVMLSWAAVVHVLHESREETRVSKSCFIFMFMVPGSCPCSWVLGSASSTAVGTSQIMCMQRHPVCWNMFDTEAHGNSEVWRGMLMQETGRLMQETASPILLHKKQDGKKTSKTPC